MLRTWVLAAVVMAAAAVGPAVAQPAQQQPEADPFNGQFAAFEVAMPAQEAARQADLMSAALSGLQPERRGKTDVYLLVVSFWGDPVFEREAVAAEALLRQHFGAQMRRGELERAASRGPLRGSILLSAGTGALLGHNYPNATPQNINAAIGRIGQRMNAAEDLLVVFFTSHGAPNGAVVMRENNRLNGVLNPMNLRDSFIDANIRNRVVIVSACFSGAFVRPLMDDQTIVITAAAADRTSFGCEPQNEWTFFGDAYFNRAVRGGASLLSAYDQASTLVSQWERERELTPPSNPQRFVGSRAASLLTQAEREAAPR